MKKNEKNQEFRSINKLSETFFPKDKEDIKSVNNFDELGIQLSQESLEKIRIKISHL